MAETEVAEPSPADKADKKYTVRQAAGLSERLAETGQFPALPVPVQVGP